MVKGQPPPFLQMAGCAAIWVLLGSYCGGAEAWLPLQDDLFFLSSCSMTLLKALLNSYPFSFPELEKIFEKALN